MYIIKLNSQNRTISLKKVVRNITLKQVGRRGEQGIQGETGSQGPAGEQGVPGEGVAPGGVAGQVLTKQSNIDFDTDWETPPTAPVNSVNGQTGDVVLDKYDVGLGNVDNTSDVYKPISNDAQTALDDKYDASNPDGFVNGSQASAAAPVQSVNGGTGTVELTGEDIQIVGAASTTIAEGISTLITNKVEKSGDTMTGTLTQSTIGSETTNQFVRDSVQVGRIDTNAAGGGGFRVQAQTGELQMRGSNNTGLRISSTLASFEMPVNFASNAASSTFVPTGDQHLTNKLYVDQKYATGQTYTVTNATTDRAYDADSTTIDEISDVLGTLIADLKTAGIIQ
jgi:hypothetical protein